MSSKVRKFHPGMGQAVAERTILRKKKNGKWENWDDVSTRVSKGNSLLCEKKEDQEKEYEILKKHIGKATLLMSGRNLQHGDEECPGKNMEIFTNCASSSSSFIMFYLLMNGCFAKGTMVKMGDGSLKPIEDIKEGDEVYTYEKETKKYVIEIVEKTFINKPKPMVEIEFENGEIIRCTADHKFLTKEGEWVQAKDLEGLDVENQNEQ